MDAAILDWAEQKDLSRDQLREALLSVFAGALTAAQTADAGTELGPA
jgi:hypothetical protein